MKKAIYFLLMFLPLLITFCARPFLPEQVPAHYNFEGEVDRFGSKYETLIFPVCTILMGVFMLWMAKIGAKESEKNGKTVFSIPEWEFPSGSPLCIATPFSWILKTQQIFTILNLI